MTSQSVPAMAGGAFRLGRTFFGLAAAASGALQLVTGEMVRLFPTAADQGGGSSAWPYLVGVVLIVAGCAIAAGRRTWAGAAVVAGLIVVSLIVESIPRLLGNPWVGHMWTNPLKSVALAAGAGLLVARPTLAGLAMSRRADRVEHLATVSLAVFLFVCGVQHFVYADFVTTLVPSWIPGQRFWTHLTGVALMAGGAGLLVPRTAWLAATLSALMVFLWVFVFHIPRAVTGPEHAHETAGVFEALAVSGVALMLAGLRSNAEK
jgi:uncharacterized membrane protein YphA (DoxX/SURF4 family)